ncbi:vitelline membrane outer layer protein 1 homolog [Penaeus japonicus]|uniref:vitelline membrane outer layer protein 1 homolog n=1 Tax=Penaeus japonicus TaxID=27405 RepID=UPI001C716341|nr:vitelline membrane outer layer protein 1 homolog [Penaeus japonicus]
MKKYYCRDKRASAKMYTGRAGSVISISFRSPLSMDSLIVVVSLVALARAAPEPLQVSESLSLDNGLNRGDWGPIELCPDGSHAYSFQIKYQDLGYADDTAVNGLKLFCRDSYGHTTGYVTSLEGKHGTWRSILSCPSSGLMEGVRGYVLPDQGTLHDDLGVDNVQMWCSGGTILDGKDRAEGALAEERLSAREALRPQSFEVMRERAVIGGREVEAVYLETGFKGAPRIAGEWSLWSYCSTGNKVCGIETRVEKESAFSDDAGLCDFVLYCCST